MTDTKTETVIQINEQANEVLTNMRRQMQGVREVWGKRDPERVLDMATTFGNALSRLPEWGDAKVFRDGDLSLLVVSQHITFGLIGHRDFRADAPQEGDPSMGIIAPLLSRFCVADSHFEGFDPVHCFKPIVRGEATCEGHEPRIFALPEPVRWSFHS